MKAENTIMDNTTTHPSMQPAANGTSSIATTLQFTLHLADTNLILSQKNAEWCGHGPILEQDIALTNISLDLLGQARNLYQYAAQLTNQSTAINSDFPATEDSLAYLRTEREFKNLLLVELPNGHWGQTILRQYLYSQFQYLFYQKLEQSTEAQLAAIAAKAIKETTYHLRWSSEWVIRLGAGTAESHQKMTEAVEALWAYTGEMFLPAPYELLVDVALLKNDWQKAVTSIFENATLPLSTAGKNEEDVYMHTGGKQGKHTEFLGFLLAELQYLQRTYPGATW